MTTRRMGWFTAQTYTLDPPEIMTTGAAPSTSEFTLIWRSLWRPCDPAASSAHRPASPRRHADRHQAGVTGITTIYGGVTSRSCRRSSGPARDHDDLAQSPARCGGSRCCDPSRCRDDFRPDVSAHPATHLMSARTFPQVVRKRVFCGRDVLPGADLRRPVAAGIGGDFRMDQPVRGSMNLVTASRGLRRRRAGADKPARWRDRSTARTLAMSVSGGRRGRDPHASRATPASRAGCARARTDRPDRRRMRIAETLRQRRQSRPTLAIRARPVCATASGGEREP
jgi:hypothetical protein